jgi:hypothetical protein
MLTWNTNNYIKSNMSKYIFPKFFYTHKLQNEGDVKIPQV